MQTLDLVLTFVLANYMWAKEKRVSIVLFFEMSTTLKPPKVDGCAVTLPELEKLILYQRIQFLKAVV